MVLATAFFGTRLEALFGEIVEDGHTARSQNLPISLILSAASHNMGQLARRETVRNSRGLTPV
jgi:hypothetical protein